LKASRSISFGKSAKKFSVAVLLLLGISWGAVPVRASEEFQPVSSDELKEVSNIPAFQVEDFMPPENVQQRCRSHVAKRRLRSRPSVLSCVPLPRLSSQVRKRCFGAAALARKARTQKGNSIVYSMNVEDNQKTLHITRQLDSDIFILEQSNYPALRRFFQLVRSGDEEQIVLPPHGPPHQLQ
jgi:hypothetical protein